MSEKINDIFGASAGIGMAAIGYLLLGVAIFLIIGIIVVIICGRRNLFKRENRVWNIFTKLYYPYIPLILAIFGGILGAIYGLQKSINKNIATQSKVLMESIIPELPEFQSFIDENLDSIEVAGFSSHDLVEKYFNRDTNKVEKGFFGGITEKVGKWAFQGAIDGLIRYSSSELGLGNSTSEMAISTLRSLDFKHLDKSMSEIASKNIIKQVNVFFKGLYFNQLLNLLFFLLVPIIEVIVYFAFFRKKLIEKNITTT